MGWHGPARKGASREHRAARARQAVEPLLLAARADELTALRARITDGPPPQTLIRRIAAAPTKET